MASTRKPARPSARPAPRRERPDVPPAPRHDPPAGAPETSEAPSPISLPSSLAFSPHGSAARSGRAQLAERVLAHRETSPAMTGGDIDADWVAAYSVGDEAPGGDNPTPGQTVVDDVGRALGVEYADEEELAGPDKVADRDRHRWELDPASAEDYSERLKPVARPKPPPATPANRRQRRASAKR